MKIALVSEWVDAWRGGAETSTLQFLHRLMETGIEIHLFTRSRPSPTPGLHVHTISGAAMGRTRKTVTFTHRVDRAIRNQSFDVVHAITPCRTADLYQPRGGTVAETIERNIAMRQSGALRSLKRQTNRFNVKQRYMLALERRLMNGSNGPVIVAISGYVADQLRRHYALPDARIRRVFNAVDPDASTDAQRAADRKSIRSEFQINDDDLLVCSIAHNFQLKGVGPWMEALALLVARGEKNVKALVIGKGDSPRWRERARRLGVAEFLRFTGPTDRVAAFRHAADVLVHLTFYDPCSRVVLEALAGGLPCITTRWDGAGEKIEDGRSGFVMDDPRAIEHVAERIGRLKNRDFRVRLGAAGRKAAAGLDMRRHTEELIAVYREVAATKMCPSSRSATRR
ncbi:MAG: glycosyltransferase family 4 protein [Phycisphaerae bacterium]